MAYEPELTAYDDAAPCPRVEVFFSEFAPGTATVTVYRTAAGREHRVRGAVEAPTAGTLTRIDFECPFNVVVSYRAEMFDSSGLSLGFTDAGTLGETFIGLPPGDDVLPEDSLLPEETVSGAGLISLDTWMHNPLDPQGAVKVRVLANSARNISRPTPGQVSYPLGRRVGVVLAEPRRGLAGFSFEVFAEDDETADRVQAIAGGYTSNTVPVACIRLGVGDASMRIPKPLFLSVLDIVEQDFDVRYGGASTVQQMTGDEVAPPVPGLFIPLLTAADVNAFFATAAALNAYRSQAFEINRLYEIAGFATA